MPGRFGRATGPADPMRRPRTDTWLWVCAGLLALAVNVGGLVVALWATLPEDDTLSGGVVQRIEIDLTESREGTTAPQVAGRDAAEAEPDTMAEPAGPPPKAPVTAPETRDPDTTSDARERPRAESDHAPTQDESPGQGVAAPAAVSAPLEDGLSPARLTPGPNADADAERIRLDWQRRLLVHLGRHKRNPSGASQSRADVTLTFVLRRDGHVLSAKVSKSSGDASIDQAAMAMMRRSNPVPPPPPVVANQGLTFTIPILFLAKGRPP